MSATEAKKLDGDHERGDLDHHHQVALLGADLAVAAAGIGATFGAWAPRAACKRPTRWSRTTDRASIPRALQAPSRRRRHYRRLGDRIPVASPDFSAYRAAAKDSKSKSIFIFVPGGAQPAALGKALAEHGVTRPTRRSWAPANSPMTTRSREWAGRARPHRRLALRPRSQLRAQRQFVKGMNGLLNPGPQSRPVRGRRL